MTCPCQTTTTRTASGHTALPCSHCGIAIVAATLVTHADHRRPVCLPCSRRNEGN